MMQKKSVLQRTYEELCEARMFSDLAVSPVDGTAAYLIRRIDFEGNRYRLELFRQRPGEEPVCLGEGAWSGLFWTKEGRLMGTQRDPKGCKLVRFGEGSLPEEERLIPRAGKLLALLDNGDCILQTRVSGNRDPELIFTEEYPLFHNDVGIIANTRGAVMHYCAQTQKLRTVTEEKFSVSTCVVDAQRGLIVARGKEYDQTAGLFEEIRVYSLEGGLVRRFLTEQQWLLNNLLLWEGKIVFTGEWFVGDDGVPQGRKIVEIDPVSGEETVLNEESLCLGNKVSSDLRFGAGQGIVAAPDGLYASITKDEHSELCRFTRETGWQTLYAGMDSVDMLDVAGGHVLFTGFANAQRPELFEYCGDGTAVQRTHFNPKLSGPMPQPMSAQANGVEIRGYVLEPEEMEEGKRYPAVLYIHGGPRMAFGRPSGHDRRMFSQGGAFALWCNPRGSDGRGRDFYNIDGDWAGAMWDLVAFVEEAKRRYPIDPERVAVVGGSYGGYMTNCLVAWTDVFCAAVSERSIASLPWEELQCDISKYFHTVEFRGSVFEDEERLWTQQSPIHDIRTGTAPTLFIQADADYRCPRMHGTSMYQALLNRGTPVRMIVFHKENHGVNRVGRPMNRLKRYQEVYDWLAKWLGLYQPDVVGEKE